MTPESQSSPDWNQVPDADDGEMSLVGHLDELRTRLIRGGTVLFLAALVAYSQAKWVLRVLTDSTPEGVKFVFLQPAEAFFSHLSVGLYGGLILSMPWLMVEVWGFLRPGLTRAERAGVKFFFPAMATCFFGGIAFAYRFILPLGITFLLGFQDARLEPMFSIRAYVTFVLSFLLVFGLAFQLPLVLFLAGRFGLVNSDELRKNRPYFVVGTAIVAAVLTPPDPATQLLLAIPVCVLYELTALALDLFPPAPTRSWDWKVEAEAPPAAPEEELSQEAPQGPESPDAEKSPSPIHPEPPPVV